MFDVHIEYHLPFGFHFQSIHIFSSKSVGRFICFIYRLLALLKSSRMFMKQVQSLSTSDGIGQNFDYIYLCFSNFNERFTDNFIQKFEYLIECEIFSESVIIQQHLIRGTCIVTISKHGTVQVHKQPYQDQLREQYLLIQVILSQQSSSNMQVDDLRFRPLAPEPIRSSSTNINWHITLCVLNKKCGKGAHVS